MALAGLLARASASAKAAARQGNEDEVLRRIGFLARGLEYARWEKRISAAAAKGDRDELKAAQRGYCEFLRDNAVADVLACHPSRIASAYYTPYMRGAF